MTPIVVVSKFDKYVDEKKGTLDCFLKENSSIKDSKLYSTYLEEFSLETCHANRWAFISNNSNRFP
jgi:D-Tyr-tRNAtyr deacylase